MREIKFRVWNPELKEMYILEKKAYLSGTAIYDALVGHEKGIWMQYTGLKDRNGKEIYEGDIVREKIGFGTPSKAPKNKPYVYCNGFVTWRKDRWIISHQKNIEEHWKTVEGNSIDWYRVHYGWREVEVIGNIYENPDLLEQK